MRLGQPYRGSKSEIAMEIIAQQPPADIFVDAFGGGGAITQAACLSHKYRQVIYNEPSNGIVDLFKHAVHGSIKDPYKWVSKEDFLKTKDSNAFNRLCWSFGNNGRGYIYGKAIEEQKHAVWNWAYYKDDSLLKKYDMPIIDLSNIEDFKKRRIACNKFYKEWQGGKTFQLESGIQIDRILEQKNFNDSIIQYSNLDYADLNILPNAIVYCDPPYKNSTEESYGGTFSRDTFNYERFYDWARKTKRCYISEYFMPEDFKCIWEHDKVVRSKVNDALIKKERLFIYG